MRSQRSVAAGPFVSHLVSAYSLPCPLCGSILQLETKGQNYRMPDVIKVVLNKPPEGAYRGVPYSGPVLLCDTDLVVWLARAIALRRGPVCDAR